LHWAGPISFSFFSYFPGPALRPFSRTGPPPRSRRSPAPMLLNPAPPYPGPATDRTPHPPVPPHTVWLQLTAPPPSTPDPPSCSLSTQPKTEPPEPSLLFLLSVRADGTRSKPSPPSPPLVAYSSTPTIGAPPLTRNLAAPPVRNKILVKVH
jgi:hypothetical protein